MPTQTQFDFGGNFRENESPEDIKKRDKAFDAKKNGLRGGSAQANSDAANASKARKTARLAKAGVGLRKFLTNPGVALAEGAFLLQEKAADKFGFTSATTHLNDGIREFNNPGGEDRITKTPSRGESNDALDNVTGLKDARSLRHATSVDGGPLANGEGGTAGLRPPAPVAAPVAAPVQSSGILSAGQRPITQEGFAGQERQPFARSGNQADNLAILRGEALPSNASPDDSRQILRGDGSVAGRRLQPVPTQGTTPTRRFVGDEAGGVAEFNTDGSLRQRTTQDQLAAGVTSTRPGATQDRIDGLRAQSETNLLRQGRDPRELDPAFRREQELRRDLRANSPKLRQKAAQELGFNEKQRQFNETTSVTRNKLANDQRKLAFDQNLAVAEHQLNVAEFNEEAQNNLAELAANQNDPAKFAQRLENITAQVSIFSGTIDDGEGNQVPDPAQVKDLTELVLSSGSEFVDNPTSQALLLGAASGFTAIDQGGQRKSLAGNSLLSRVIQQFNEDIFGGPQATPPANAAELGTMVGKVLKDVDNQGFTSEEQVYQYIKSQIEESGDDIAVFGSTFAGNDRDNVRQRGQADKMARSLARSYFKNKKTGKE